MRRSICYSEPSNAIAGQKGTWKFIYTTATPLPKGTKIKFDLLTQGRAIDWDIPQTDLKEKANIIWAETKNQKISAVPSTNKQTAQTFFEFLLPSELKIGETFIIHIGTTLSLQEKGNTCQKTIQRKRPFYLYIDPKGKGDYKEGELFQMDIKGGPLNAIRAITPSLVARNKRFDVIVRFEDSFGNLTNNAPLGTLIELSYEHLRENLNWKIFVPETGFITLPNLYFNEPGVYKIKLHNLKNNEIFFSDPIKCLSESNVTLFWGFFHGESERYDSLYNIDSSLRHFRDDQALNFYATSSFDSEEETPTDNWKALTSHIAEFNEDDRFITFLGSQWEGEPSSEGVRQFLYTKENKNIFRKKDTKTSALKKIYKSLSPKELLSIPTFTMGGNSTYTFDEFQPEFEKVVEIYNAWGSSECTSGEGNPRPIKGTGKGSVEENPAGSIQRALKMGCRFGFIAGGLDDRGIYDGLYDSDQEQYSPGLTAILAKEQTKASLIEALHHRLCYATTGARIIVGFSIAGSSMGSELNNKTKPGLDFNRHISGYALGNAAIQEIAIIRNGEILQKLQPKDYHTDFTYDDTTPLHQILLQGKFSPLPFVYYYLRVIQENGHIAWSSPIWIDYHQGNHTHKLKQKK